MTSSTTDAAGAPFDKRALRNAMRQRLKALSSDARAAAGRDLVGALSPLLDDVKGPVAFFASLALEIDTAPLDDALRARRCPRALPAVVGDALVFRRLPDEVSIRTLVPAAFSVPTPLERWPVSSLSDCGLVVVPGLAFTLDGGRLGWGKGYYDRALAPLFLSAGGTRRPRLVGVGHAFQVVDNVPIEPHDVALDAIATPDGLVRCRPR